MNVEKGSAVSELTGVVTFIYNFRACDALDEDELALQQDGPLADQAKHVFNVELKAVDPSADVPRNKHRINLFLYDRWAEKCRFISAGDVVTVTGPASIVHENSEHAHDSDEHPLCIAIQGTSIVPSSRSVKLHVRSPRIQNSMNAVEMTSETVETIQIPLEETRKQRRQRPSDAVAAPSGAAHGRQKRRRQSSVAERAEADAREAGDYQYHTLADLVPGSKVDYNVYAVVTSWHPCKPCRGSHKYSASYQLADMSRHDPTSPVVLNVFSNDPSLFPAPLRVGDVLRCHRVRAQRWQGLLQLIGHPEKGTAFVVFSPVIDLLTGNFILNPNPPEAEPDGVEETKGDELPSTLEAEFNRLQWTVNTPSLSYTFTSRDKRHAMALTHWARDFLRTTRVNERTEQIPTLTLSRIEQLRSQQAASGEGAEGEAPRERAPRCDVLCMIVNINDQERPPRVAVWDGTNPGTMALQNTEDFAENAAPDYVYSTIQAARHYSTRNDEYVHSGHVHNSLLGATSTLQVREHWQSIKELAIGTWVMFRNLYIDNTSLPEGVCGEVTAETHCNSVPPFSREVINCVKQHDERCEREGVVARPPPLRTVSRIGLPLSALAQALALPAPAKFCSRLKLVGYWPTNVNKFVISVPKPIDKRMYHLREYPSDGVTLEYLFALRFSDHTATADIIVAQEDALFFMGGITAETFAADSNVRDVLKAKLDAYISAGVVWEVYLRSYMTLTHPEDEDHRPMLKRLRMFATQL